MITLGIIGVVAAMTMPALIQKNNNKVVETRLMKFYSTINQAIKMAEVDYGDKKYWSRDLKTETDSSGESVLTFAEREKWFNKYISPYMKILKTEKGHNDGIVAYLPDGSAFSIAPNNIADWYFYTDVSCIPKSYDEFYQFHGKCIFTFAFTPDSSKSYWKYHYNKGVEPYKYTWDGDIDRLKEACYRGANLGDSSVSPLSYCTALIQMNDWKIPDDYTHKVRY